MEAIPSPVVAVKINEWYKHIKRFNVKEAEVLREEIRKEIDVMEEDEQAVLYFQLMEFRHQLMADYVQPSEEPLEKSDYLKAVEGQGKKMAGILEYYFNFFQGMYEFKSGEFIKAIVFYKRAEKRLEQVADELERAEFYYKLSEVFYHMKQTHMSMYYVGLAYDAYRSNSNFVVREINCLTVVAGNYIDLEHREKALSQLLTVLEKAKTLKNQHMIFRALHNIGSCYEGLGDNIRAMAHFHQAIEIGSSIGEKVLLTYYRMAMIHLKNKEFIEGQNFYRKSFEQAEIHNDELYFILLEFMKKLFFDSANLSDILNVLEKLNNIKRYRYMEDLALEGAQFYTKSGRMDESVKLYEKVIYARKQIQRGDCLYEF
ncbi:Rap family tetratricopeptide repeat protein [Bacillus sp. 005/A4HT-01/001]|uniref:Rap family tetratricopeptide repeat protein n=1 Tax=Bacillus sp. 005/A4HT-01/001 TaxID=2509010 RepID=UPI001074D9CC|nr:Rap family tetratricopeptide repeat protein [Bacillus sp. 005/A4HT-01/001]TFW45534.1 tetratricopeptide repeat protein [Bacillus sp. 005/A4HT-01/001]